MDKQNKAPSDVTPNRVAHHLFINGKSDNICEKARLSKTQKIETNYFNLPFALKNLTKE